MLPSDAEGAACHYKPEAYCWIFDNVRLIEPVPIKGQMGIFDVFHDLIKLSVPTVTESSNNQLYIKMII